MRTQFLTYLKINKKQCIMKNTRLKFMFVYIFKMTDDQQRNDAESELQKEMEGILIYLNG